MKKVPISSDFIHTKDIKSHGNKVSNLIAMSLYFFFFKSCSFLIVLWSYSLPLGNAQLSIIIPKAALATVPHSMPSLASLSRQRI